MHNDNVNSNLYAMILNNKQLARALSIRSKHADFKGPIRGNRIGRPWPAPGYSAGPALPATC